jgi:3-carboxy-cis,cis-muconate cycloisomerase
MPPRLTEALVTTAPLAELFSDESVIRAMVKFEVALASAEARSGVIPRSAASAIAAVARSFTVDPGKLAHASFRAGTISIPLVKELTEAVRRKNSAAAGYVHWGATSQDVSDTALVLLLKEARPIVAADLDRLESSLKRLSVQHKKTVMLGRTLLQPAPPVTFGLKAANWLGAIHRSREALESAFDEVLALQLGGASGTLAALGKSGVRVARELARELGLAMPDAPWHTQRDRLAAAIAACGVLVGTLGKMARDILLLTQAEVGEVSEPGGSGRGGSSTMPHKRNPIGCALTLSTATRVPHLVAAFLSAMPQEHERGIGGWHSEWATVASVIQSTGVAASSMAEVANGMSVHPRRMRANLDATGGVIFAEKAMMLLAPKIGRDRAHVLVEAAVERATGERKRLAEALAGTPEVTRLLPAAAVRRLEEPEDYLGSAEDFREAQLTAIAGANVRREKRNK